MDTETRRDRPPGAKWYQTMGEGARAAVCGFWLAWLVAYGVDASVIIGDVRLDKPLVTCLLGGRWSCYDLAPGA